jgi:hypothetical protein
MLAPLRRLMIRSPTAMRCSRAPIMVGRCAHLPIQHDVFWGVSQGAVVLSHYKQNFNRQHADDRHPMPQTTRAATSSNAASTSSSHGEA